jgi:Domain of unknown function (DUF4386)
MNLRITARIVGTLFLAAMVGSLVGGVAFVEPFLTAPDYLTAVSENETRVIIGVFLELINGIAVLGIGVFMFPILRQRDERIALGYLGLRIVESIFCCVIVISPLSLITLSQAYVQAGAANAAYYQAAGALSIAEREGVAGLLIPVFSGLGSLLFYRALYRFRFLPRFISVWGFVGAALILVLNLLLAFGVQVGSAGMALALPIISNEILLGIWLIAKGFDPSATASGDAE